jgi:phage-related protein
VPTTAVYFYQEKPGDVPVVQWLKELRSRDKKAFAKCDAVIEMLRQFGHELRRPQADFLRDGIYELRARSGHVNYRLLYFFYGKDVAVLAHSLTKERKIPAADFERAIARKLRFEKAPQAHVYKGGLEP